jgi:hypothetical protein
MSPSFEAEFMGSNVWNSILTEEIRPIDTSKARNVDQQQSLSPIHSDMDTIGIMQGNR